MAKLLEIKDLRVNVEEKEILQGISLDIHPGEIHVLMGPNGAGKSTLANAVMAHPKYTVTGGDMLFEGESLLPLTADERARKGIFMSFQNPFEVPGIRLEDFLRSAKSEKTGKSVPVLKFKKEVATMMAELSLNSSYGERYVNVGFSGGEKKKTEMLQMKVLDPKLVMLDETDSGLDVDAVRVVSKEVANFLTPEKGCLIITHHSDILTSLVPDVVHILVNGKLVQSGGRELVDRIREEGYEWVTK